MSNTDMDANSGKGAPTKAVWILLVIAWICFLVPFPGIGLFLGAPLNFVAFIIAIVVITRGKTGVGITQLILTLVVSPIVYFTGLAIFGAALDSTQPEKEAFDYGQLSPAPIVSLV
ncbi:hypothetical protein QWY79_12205 [Halomonas sabkhae]|uniref:hypothetical protein n=1 Tax=Halomonas sabkhae TaxID=626223 RepID=UPI0025B50B64|nr:hypothetical protein [Halomonas sabkhae]MDN3526027.1 hypothetical protein [Halomonas sabkhae]